MLVLAILFPLAVWVLVYGPITPTFGKYFEKGEESEEEEVSEEAVGEVLEETGEMNISVEELESEIEEILDQEKDNYAVYVKGLNNDFELGINEDEKFFPASIFKVPIAILVLRDIEAGRYSLETEIVLRESNKHYASDQMYHFPTGSSYTVKTLLKYMIKYSDNTAWDMLQDHAGTTQELDVRIKNELELKQTSRVPYESTAEEIGKMLEGIYEGRYLSRENSQYMLDLLSDIAPSQNDRIPAGVPEGTKVAHKIGTWNGTYQDAGIVFGESGAYVIVVLNRNTNAVAARGKIRGVSEVVWERVRDWEY